jgi:type IV secretion system protein VirB4
MSKATIAMANASTQFTFRAGDDVATRTRTFYEQAGRTCAEWVDWLTALDERTILNKNGSMLAVFELTGMDLDSNTNSDVNQARGQVLYALEQMQDASATVWWQVRRRRTYEYPSAQLPDPVSQGVDDDLRADFLEHAQFVNRHHIVFSLAPAAHSMRLLQMMRRSQETEGAGIWNAAKALLSGLAGLARGDAEFPYSGEHEVQEALEQFHKHASEFAAALSGLGIRPLMGEELGGFLELASSPTAALDQKAPLSPTYLDANTCVCEIDNSYRDALHFTSNHREVWAAAYSLDYSKRDKLSLDMLDALMAAPFEFTLSHTFQLLPRAKAARAAAQYQRYHANRRYPLRSYIVASARGGDMSGAPINEERDEQANEALAIQNRLAIGKEGAGLYYGTVLIQAETPALLTEHTSKCEELLQSARIRPVMERLHKFSSFCATVPGSQREVVLWKKLTTENFADLCPLRTVSAGDLTNEYLSEQTGNRCPALLVLPTKHRTPLYYTGYVEDLGHGMMIGPSGTGKTTFINLTWTQFRKYQDARVIILDKDNSTRPSVLLQGGSYLDLSPEKVRVGVKRACMGPLRALLGPEHQGRHIPFIVEWLLMLASMHGYTPVSDDKIALDLVVKSVAEQGADHPEKLRISSIVVSLDATTRLAAELLPWAAEHVYGAYFDNEVDNLDVNGLVAIENGSILENEALAAPYMYYLFYRIQSQLRALKEQNGTVSPTFIYVPEMWYFIRNEMFQGKFFEFLVTLRKLLGVVWLDTQSPDQLVASNIYSALRDNIATTVLTPNRKALTSSLSTLYLNEFLLSQEELQAIAVGTKKRDYLIKQGGLSRQVSLNLPPSVVAVLRSDKRAQMLIDQHIDEQQVGWQAKYISEISRA